MAPGLREAYSTVSSQHLEAQQLLGAMEGEVGQVTLLMMKEEEKEKEEEVPAIDQEDRPVGPEEELVGPEEELVGMAEETGVVPRAEDPPQAGCLEGTAAHQEGHQVGKMMIDLSVHWNWQ